MGRDGRTGLGWRFRGLVGKLDPRSAICYLCRDSLPLFCRRRGRGRDAHRGDAAVLRAFRMGDQEANQVGFAPLRERRQLAQALPILPRETNLEPFNLHHEPPLRVTAGYSPHALDVVRMPSIPPDR